MFFTLEFLNNEANAYNKFIAHQQPPNVTANLLNLSLRITTTACPPICSSDMNLNKKLLVTITNK